MTIEEFYAARLNEDEIRAKAALGEWDDEASRYEWEDLPADSYAHARNHDPRRVLREVEAGRKMLVRYEFACRQAVVNTGAERESWEKIAGALERDVADRAAVWSDHPDYGKWENPE